MLIRRIPSQDRNCTFKICSKYQCFPSYNGFLFQRFWPKKSPKFCQPKFQITPSISIPEALEEVAIKPGETIFSACSDAEIEGFDSKALPGSALTDVALDPKLDKEPLKLDEKNRLVEGYKYNNR